jgi:hypothetical protein
VKVQQASPIACSLVRVKGQAIATYDVVAFLDARTQDLGGRTVPVGHGPVCNRVEQLVEIGVAIAVILALPSLVVLVSVKQLYL